MIGYALLALLVECCEIEEVSLQVESIYVISSDYCLPPCVTLEDDIRKRESDCGHTPLLYELNTQARSEDMDRPRQQESSYG